MNTTKNLADVQIVNSPASEVEREMEQLSGALNRLREIESQLISRVGPILRAVPGTKGGESAVPPEVMLCPHADRIRDRRKTVESVTANLEETLLRIEL